MPLADINSPPLRGGERSFRVLLPRRFAPAGLFNFPSRASVAMALFPASAMPLAEPVAPPARAGERQPYAVLLGPKPFSLTS